MVLVEETKCDPVMLAHHITVTALQLQQQINTTTTLLDLFDGLLASSGLGAQGCGRVPVLGLETCSSQASNTAGTHKTHTRPRSVIPPPPKKKNASVSLCNSN